MKRNWQLRLKVVKDGVLQRDEPIRKFWLKRNADYEAWACNSMYNVLYAIKPLSFGTQQYYVVRVPGDGPRWQK